MSVATIARPVRPVMTDLTAALYKITGDLLDAAMLEAEANPGPGTQHAAEVCALAYQTIAEEYQLD